MFAHDLCHSRTECLKNSIKLDRKDRATCLDVLSKEGVSDTTNIQSSIDNIQFGSGFAGLGMILGMSDYPRTLLEF